MGILIKMSGIPPNVDGRQLSYLQDVIGGISTYISVTAGLINLIAWATTLGQSAVWQAVWTTELIWSGIVEVSAILLVLLTDSSILRAIGGFSMVAVNTTSLFLIYSANLSAPSWNYIVTFTMHGIALGQAIDTFLKTFVVNTKDGSFRNG